jgi:hypothetical protein
MARVQSPFLPPLDRLFDDRSRHLDRFGPLLALTVATIATGGLLDLRYDGSDLRHALVSFLVTVTAAATLLLAARAAGLSRRWRISVDVVMGIGVLAALLLVMLVIATGDGPEFGREVGPSLVWLVLAVLAPPAVIGRLLRHRSVTGRTLQGAVVGYLLLAVAYFFVFLTIDRYQTEPFFAGADRELEPTSSYMYFSLTTITTLGFGDLAPLTPLGRLAATSEALIGQVYLVTFVAMLVGLLIKGPDRDPADG